MNPGKRFEGKFHESIKHLPGASMRIMDGGRYAPIQQWGDFFYFAPDDTFLFECKATHLTRFPHDKIQDHQIKKLKGFSDLSRNRHSIIVINFYGEDIRKKNDCVLIDIDAYLKHLEDTTRSSLSEAEAREIGEVMEREKGNIWFVDPWAVI